MESESPQRRRFKVGEKTKQIDGENFDASSAQGTSGHIRAQGQGKDWDSKQKYWYLAMLGNK